MSQRRGAPITKPRQVSGSSTHTWSGKDAVTVTELDWNGPRPLLLIRAGGSEITLDAKQWGFVAPNAERLFRKA